MKNRSEYLYCYNLEQANFFKSLGIPDKDLGFNKEKNKIFIRFKRGSELDKGFELWNKGKTNI